MHLDFIYIFYTPKQVPEKKNDYNGRTYWLTQIEAGL